ncbi:MAG: S-layer family protein [Phormidesmis sp.]
MPRPSSNRVLGLAAGLCWTSPGWALPAAAQSVTPTLGSGNVGTVVDGTAAFTVTGGSQQLNTLFHSFKDFSPETADVWFQLDGSQSEVEYVIGRVTGGNLSNINGWLELTGGNSPDLVLINPNGIAFGEDAYLALPGSFFASTAQSVLFEGGLAFDSANPGTVPLLTVSAPTGLQFGQSANAITVTQSYLSLEPEQSLGLLGGDVEIANSYIPIDGGKLRLGSVGPNSQVGINGETFLVDYADVRDFQDITLQEGSYIDVSGDGGGTFQVQSRNFRIIEDSLLEASNLGPTGGTEASVNATEMLEISGNIFVDAYSSGQGSHLLINTGQLSLTEGAGITADSLGAGDSSDIAVNASEIFISNGLLTSGAFDAGNAGDLNIRTDRLVLSNEGQVVTGTRGSGQGGRLTVAATESIEVRGVEGVGESAYLTGFIASAENNSTGDAGDIYITAPRLSVVRGSQIASSATGSGRSGNIVIRADDIEIAETVGLIPFFATGIVTDVLRQATGNGGMIDIEANSLRISSGGQVNSSTTAQGNAGTVNVRVRDIEVAGQSENGLFRSAIASSSVTNYDAGSVNLTSETITVRDGAELSVSSLGGGNAGNINVLTDQLYLNNGFVRSQASAGSESNITIQANRSLMMRQGSQITASATGSATGGNIALSAPVVVGLENSDITGNAVDGNGGNIRITTRGLFGLQFREQSTPESDITATSQFGLSGIVEINNLTVNPGEALVQLPELPVNADDQIAAACSSTAGNQFIASGRGGLPPSPSQELSIYRPWVDFRDLSALPDGQEDLDEGGAEVSAASIDESVEPTAAESPTLDLVEAGNWTVNSRGDVELLAASTDTRAEIFLENCLAQSS